MKIDVLTMTGKRLRFEIHGSHTLDDLEDAVQDAEGIPWDQQRLVLEGKQLVHGGSLMDEIERIRGLNEETRESSLIEIWLILRLRGGGNQIFHRPRRGGLYQSSDDRKITRIRRISVVDSDDSDDDGDDRSGGKQSGDQYVVASPRFSSEHNLSQNGMLPSSSNLALVQYSSETSLSRDRLKKFGFGSKTAYPLESNIEEIKESNIEKVHTFTIEGGDNQVLCGIPHSVTEHIKGKETMVLYCEGIDQIIQGMYSLQLFRSRVESEKQMALSEQMPQIEELIRMISMTQFALDRSNKEVLELREEKSELKNEITNLKKLANDAGSQGYDRGYERAVKDVEECIANEHPEWDLSFIQSYVLNGNKKKKGS